MVHLHLHTKYSLRDAILAIDDEFLTELKNKDVTAVAVTEHGNLASAIEFYFTVQTVAKPIIGIELYYVEDDRKNRKHLIALAKNNNGLKNLIKINNIAHLENFYYYPLVTKPTLIEYASDLIFLSGCINSPIIQYSDLFLELRERAECYCEIMPHTFVEQKKHNYTVIEYAKKHGFPIVITQDVHYLKSSQYEVVNKIRYIYDLPLVENSFYLTSVQEIETLIKQEHQYMDKSILYGALDNAYKISEMCNITFDTTPKLPKKIKEKE